MKTSYILENGDIKQLFFIFFNLGTVETENFFKFDISYRQSKLADIELTEKLMNKNNDLLSSYTGMDFQLRNKHHTFKLEKNYKISRKEFLNKIYKKIEQARFLYDDYEFEQALYMGLFAFRGSADITANFYSVDLLSCNISEDYIKNLLSLLLSSYGNRQLNLNFRELQPEHVNNKSKRNTQVRVNLKWFFNNYINSIAQINEYKASILNANKSKIETKNIVNSVNNTFIERLLFYKDKIVTASVSFNTLSDEQKKREIQKLREDLEFEDKFSENHSNRSRNQDIVRTAAAFLPHECVGCKDDYPLIARTFLRKNSDIPYLEIHHVVSFGSGKNSDVLENLVKLCPACHRALTPNRANEEYQRKLITNIINNSPIVYDYLENFLSENSTFNDKVNFVYNKLK